ncbi:MAG: DEAD/DEAH box helicase [Candidatus Syntropharchaeia archaeon]
MKVDELNIDSRIKRILKERIDTLYPPQEEAIRKGILKGRENFLLSFPTAAGKTLLAELVMLKSIVEENGKCFYVVPLNALAQEKYRDFSRYNSIARIGISTGDYDSSSRYLEKNDITILTLEKFDSLTRTAPDWLNEISVVVLDEIHIVGDRKRGPRIEGAVARFRTGNPKARFIGLSATIPNIDEFASWLGAKVVKSEWRPVPLREEILLAPDDRDVVKYIVKTIEEGGQVLVFVNTRKGSSSFARKIAKKLEKVPELEEIAERVDLGVDDLGEMVRHGVAYHNSWLHPEQRRLIEESFRDRLLKVICCTPTLSMGVSTPARVALIRNYRFYFPGEGNIPMPVFWVKQVFGRAGRPEYDDHGIGVIVARSEEEKKTLEDLYIGKESEKINSAFSEEMVEEQVLATIVGGARTRDSISTFIENTFYAHQGGKLDFDWTLYSLERNGFILIDGDFLRPTPFGSLVSRLYISLRSALDLKEGLSRIRKKEPSDFDLIVLMCRCEEVVPLRVEEEAINKALRLSENKEWLWESEHVLGSAIVTWEWIEETPYSEIREKFGIYPGEVYGTLYVLEWISYASSRISEYLGYSDLSGRFRVLGSRIKHGIKPELIDLASIRGVGRVIARRLFASGYRRREDVAKAGVDDLARVYGIGRKLAEKIREEARRR